MNLSYVLHMFIDNLWKYTLKTRRQSSFIVITTVGNARRKKMEYSIYILTAPRNMR